MVKQNKSDWNVIKLMENLDHDQEGTEIKNNS